MTMFQSVTNLARRLQFELSPRMTWLRIGIVRDDLKGVDFLRTIQPQQVGLDPELAFRSSPSGDRYLRAALRELSIGPADRIIDIGCGKGSALRVMLEFPFAKVAGIDLSPQIVQIARNNFERLKVPAARIQVSAADASSFEGLDEFNYLYAYNPFPAPVFELFKARLLESLQRAPRPLIFLYNNPLCEAQLLERGKPGGRFEPVKEFATGNELRMVAYRYQRNP